MAAVKTMSKKITSLCGGGNGPGGKMVTYTYTHANPYATGGDPANFSADFPEGNFVVIVPPLVDNAAAMPVYDYTNKKLKLYIQDASDAFVERGTADASGIVYKVHVLGN